MKKEKTVIVLQIFLILVVTIGITFAVKTTYDNIVANVGTANLGVVYVGSESVTGTDLLPVTSSEIATHATKATFTVKGAQSNPTNVDIYYDVTLSNISIGGGLLDENFKFQVLKNGEIISSGNFKNLEKENNELNFSYYQRAILTETPQILPSYTDTADSYEIRFYILENNISQEHMMDQEFTADLEISLYTSKGGSMERDRYTNLIEYKTDLIVSSNLGSFSHGLYTVTTNCDNAESRYVSQNREFRIKNLDGFSNCQLTYTKDNTEYPTLYQKIYTNYNKGDNTKHIYLEEHDYNVDDDLDYYEYRYEGTDTEVENYVWFNNELWRIIGAFPGGTPSTVTNGTFNLGNGAPSTENTVKIIRNDVIGSFAWNIDGTYGVNDWTTAELNTNILNNLYLNSSSGTCDFYSTSVSKPCSFESNGLKNMHDYIAEVTWNLGGYDSATNPTDMYKYERGTTVYNDTSNPRPYLTTAKVGLMYPSDYGYSTSSDSCQTGTNLSSYNRSCGSNGWILKNGFEWTQSPRSSRSDLVWMVSSNANVSNRSAYDGAGVRPVVYLKSNIYVTGGSGSITNPYQIRVGG